VGELTVIGSATREFLFGLGMPLGFSSCNFLQRDFPAKEFRVGPHSC
jgi:hypothetical protein